MMMDPADGVKSNALLQVRGWEEESYVRFSPAALVYGLGTRCRDHPWNRDAGPWSYFCVSIILLAIDCCRLSCTGRRLLFPGYLTLRPLERPKIGVSTRFAEALLHSICDVLFSIFFVCSPQLKVRFVLFSCHHDELTSYSKPTCDLPLTYSLSSAQIIEKSSTEKSAALQPASFPFLLLAIL